jgi:two-component system CheB/CheR fusion protein
MAMQDRHFIVVFENAVESPRTATPPRKRGKPTAADPSATLHLEQELASTREYLHSALGQHASANEELGAANEELQSINEELLSMNEELQTAKEELQSTNEELETVNDELRSGNERLAVLNDDLVNVLASIEIAIIIVDAEHQVRRYTPRALAIMNLIPGDIGRRITDLRPVIEIEDLGGALAGVMESLVPYEAEVRDASSGWYRMQIRPYRTAANKIDGAVISFVDIGTLRRSVEEARTTRDYAEAIVATVPSPLAVLDADRRITSANRAFFATFQVAPDAAIGHTLLQVGAGRWRTGGAALEAALATGGSFDDIVVEREDDDDVRVLQIGARVFAEGRPYDRLVLVGMLDITDRIRVEEERARARRIVVDAAEATAREKDAFLNAVSHELRTPLNAILLWTDLLRRGEPDAARLKHALETIELSARAEARLVDDLLDLAVLRSPVGPEVALDEVDPSPIVEAALDAVRADADAKQVVIELELDRTLRVRADPLRLQQIAWNLAANAIKFTPEGGRVNVRLSRQLGSVELGVKDSGRGISAELLPRVFDAFWQADQSTTRSEQGLGIGLALVRHLVERQGGTIRVDSHGEGTGATFTVQLPCDPT